MKNKEILRKIYYENRAINRNIQRLANIGLIGLLARSAKDYLEKSSIMMRMEERSEKVDPISWEDIAFTIQMVIKPVRVDLASLEE